MKIGSFVEIFFSIIDWERRIIRSARSIVKRCIYCHYRPESISKSDMRIYIDIDAIIKFKIRIRDEVREQYNSLKVLDQNISGRTEKKRVTHLVTET